MPSRRAVRRLSGADMTVALVIGAVLAVACVVLVALPFLREPRTRDDRLARPDELEQRRLALAEERDRALEALKELEFDHRTGKVSDGDYRARSEEHTSELQSRRDLVCRLLLEKTKKE